MAKTRCAFGQYLNCLSISSKSFLLRLAILKPVVLCRYSFICAGLFGFSIPVSCCASANSCALYSLSKRAAFSASWRSNITPRSLIRWSMVYSTSSNAAGSSLRTLANICCSTSTSRILYALNVSHLSGASAGRCRLPRFGTLKYRISAAPSFILPSESLSTSPHCPSDSGKPIRAARTIVHFHWLASISGHP